MWSCRSAVLPSCRSVGLPSCQMPNRIVELLSFSEGREVSRGQCKYVKGASRRIRSVLKSGGPFESDDYSDPPRRSVLRGHLHSTTGVPPCTTGTEVPVAGFQEQSSHILRYQLLLSFVCGQLSTLVSPGVEIADLSNC